MQGVFLTRYLRFLTTVLCLNFPVYLGMPLIVSYNLITVACLKNLISVDIDECASSPCKNGGTCIDGLNSFTCECKKCFCSDSDSVTATCEIGEISTLLLVKLILGMQMFKSLLAIIAHSAVQLSALAYIHNAILCSNTSNNP